MSANTLSAASLARIISGELLEDRELSAGIGRALVERWQVALLAGQQVTALPGIDAQQGGQEAAGIDNDLQGMLFPVARQLAVCIGLDRAGIEERQQNSERYEGEPPVPPGTAILDDRNRHNNPSTAAYTI